MIKVRRAASEWSNRCREELSVRSKGRGASWLCASKRMGITAARNATAIGTSPSGQYMPRIGTWGRGALKKVRSSPHQVNIFLIPKGLRARQNGQIPSGGACRRKQQVKGSHPLSDTCCGVASADIETCVGDGRKLQTAQGGDGKTAGLC